jgi:apolipoprotein N-acyltransferase
VIAIAAVALAVALAAVAPEGDDTGRSTRVALVQGGGPQGTRASATRSRDVVERHLAATRSIEPGAAAVVVWPENVVDVVTFADSMERTEIATEADRLRAPVLVGITEDVAQRPDRFLNAQVVVTPAGDVTGRYDKVRRVPFGEYVPGRALLEALGAPVDQVPTDAVAGIGPAVLDVPVRGEDTMRVAVVISWEVFFGDRARDGVRNGGTMLINPTNGSSYTGTILQTQQVASSRLRAAETGRWVGQVSPTGFSAFVSPGGTVFARTGVSEAAVLVRDVPQRTGRTWYTSAGDWPVEIALAAALVLSIGLPARERRAAQRLTTAAGPPRTRSPDRR